MNPVLRLLGHSVEDEEFLGHSVLSGRNQSRTLPWFQKKKTSMKKIYNERVICVNSDIITTYLKITRSIN